MQVLNGLAWWEPQQVSTGQTLSCRIGPFHLRIERTATEWRIATDCEEEAPDSTPPATLELTGESLLNDDGIERFVTPRSDGPLRLKPLLPDRAVVIRPRQPLFLSSNSETVLYLSVPVWLQIGIGTGQPTVLREVPTLRLSDTWFGPSTREGEFCYSDKTRARSTLAEVPYRPHRILTPVTIRNEADTILPLEKLSLPVPALSVYGAADGSLHTQGVSLFRRSDSDMATMKIDEKPPSTVGQVSLISSPRQAGRSGLVRAFSLLFGT